MTRKEFLMELDRRLDVLPREDADKYLNYYAEMLADRMEDGMTEEEAVASMEPLDTIINRILGEWYTTPRKPKLPLRRIAAIAAIVVVAVCVAVSVRNLVYQVMFGSVAISTATDYVTETIVDIEGEAIDFEAGTSVEDSTDSGMVIPMDGIHNLSICWTSDSVRIIPCETDHIIIECDHTVSAEVQGDTLVIGSLLSNTSGSLSVFLPTTLAEGGLGELSISVTSANVEMNGVDAQVLSLSTTSGDCTVTGTFGTAEITTTSADVMLCGSVESIAAKSVSGSLTLDMNYALQTLLASSVSGDIELNFPSDLGYTMDFDTSSGSISSDYLSSNGSSASYTHGDGTVALTVSTVSGSVNVYEY